jgi:hypothetical protein
MSAAPATVAAPEGSGEALAVAPLTRVEAQWFTWICAALFPEPPRGPYPVAITSLEPARFYARLCAEARFDHHLTLRAALWVVALIAPVVVLGRLRTLGGLTVEEREGVLLGMIRSRHYLLRQLAFLMKAQAGQVYCAHDVVRRRLTTSRSRPRAPSGDGLVALRTIASPARSPRAPTTSSDPSTDLSSGPSSDPSLDASTEHPQHEHDEHAA